VGIIRAGGNTMRTSKFLPAVLIALTAAAIFAQTKSAATQAAPGTKGHPIDGIAGLLAEYPKDRLPMRGDDARVNLKKDLLNKWLEEHTKGKYLRVTAMISGEFSADKKSFKVAVGEQSWVNRYYKDPFPYPPNFSARAMFNADLADKFLSIKPGAKGSLVGTITSISADFVPNGSGEIALSIDLADAVVELPE
jgi:hypothetical protein